jgi:hypothetical protein
METLDQLIGGPMPLPLIRSLFPNGAHFVDAILKMLSNGDILLLGPDGLPIDQPCAASAAIQDAKNWSNPSAYSLDITSQGAQRVS